MAIADPKSSVHAPFAKSIKAWVSEEILFNMDPKKNKLRECKIIGLSSYKDSALTAEILIREGEHFSTIWADVPLHMLFQRKAKPPPDTRLGLDDVIYHNNPDDYIEFAYFPALAHGNCQCYFPRKNLWLSGTYLGTVDWYKSNHCAHLVALENGQFAMLPNHKIQFNDGPRELPPYQKQRMAWTVDK